MTSALVESIKEHFSDLNDPRRETKNKHHQFIDVLIIAICGAICGANHWTGIAAYGRSKEEWLRTFLELPNGIPSHDTFNDIFINLKPDRFEKCFASWVSSISRLMPGEVVSVDGKTLRRSHDNANGKSAIHMVSAWSTKNELVLGQIKTEEKSNEITAIPQLLETLSIEKSLVTIDAMGCQKKIAQSIVDQGADYLLAVKENQPTLYDAIDRLFNESGESEFDDLFTCSIEKTNQGHGRTETRRCWVSQELKDLPSEDWKKLNSIVVIESEREFGDKTSIEHRYYISSKSRSAEYFLESTRNHLHIENKLHWTLDVAFREDESRLRKGDGAENFAVLRRIALNLLKKEKTEKAGIETKRLRSGWDNKYLIKVLSGLVS